MEGVTTLRQLCDVVTVQMRHIVVTGRRHYDVRCDSWKVFLLFCNVLLFSKQLPHRKKPIVAIRRLPSDHNAHVGQITI